MPPKHSFRVLFKDRYGAGKLRFPVFPDSTITNFDTLTLRAGFNNTWHWQVAEQRERAQLIHDIRIGLDQLDRGEGIPSEHVLAELQQRSKARREGSG